MVLMPLVTDTDGILRQNLVDAECGPEIVRQCMVLARKQNRSELIRVLSRHRRALLNALHQSERQIDCLGYVAQRLGRIPHGQGSL